MYIYMCDYTIPQPYHISLCALDNTNNDDDCPPDIQMSQILNT